MTAPGMQTQMREPVPTLMAQQPVSVLVDDAEGPEAVRLPHVHQPRMPPATATEPLTLSTRIRYY